jgi:hypothetical protein
MNMIRKISTAALPDLTLPLYKTNLERAFMNEEDPTFRLGFQSIDEKKI